MGMGWGVVVPWARIGLCRVGEGLGGVGAGLVGAGLGRPFFSERFFGTFFFIESHINTLKLINLVFGFTMPYHRFVP